MNVWSGLAVKIASKNADARLAAAHRSAVRPKLDLDVRPQQSLGAVVGPLDPALVAVEAAALARDRP
jgi:hypothetical protein